jgi:hypothetical protein
MPTRLSCLLAVLFPLAACGGSSKGHPDAALPPDIDADLGGTPDADLGGTPDADLGNPADAGPDADLSNPSPLAGLMPQDVLSNPTQILASPVVVPITFSDDPNQAFINAYYSAYGASAAWIDQVGEYGIGALSEGTPENIGAMPGSITEGDLMNDLMTNLTAGGWGDPDPSTIYAFHIPSTVNYNGGACCGNYDGYHFDTVINGVDVAYAVICSCPGEATQFGISLTEDMGVTMGHETVEASSDPFPSSASTAAYASTDDAHAAWTYATEGELGDLCQYADTEIWLNAAGTNATQRTWSNAAAAAGHDPCVGAPTEPYYQSVPTDPDTGTVTFSITDASGSNSWATQGTRVAVGSTGTISLQVLSDVPTAGPFTIAVQDLTAFQGGTGHLQFGAVTGTYNSGDTATVSVHVVDADPSMTGGEAYVVETSPAGGGGPTTYYFALVIQ